MYLYNISKAHNNDLSLLPKKGVCSDALDYITKLLIRLIILNWICPVSSTASTKWKFEKFRFISVGAINTLNIIPVGMRWNWLIVILYLSLMY